MNANHLDTIGELISDDSKYFSYQTKKHTNHSINILKDSFKSFRDNSHLHNNTEVTDPSINSLYENNLKETR